MAALLITFLTFGTMVVFHRQSPARSTEAYILMLFRGPLLGTALAAAGGSVVLAEPRSGLRTGSATSADRP